MDILFSMKSEELMKFAELGTTASQIDLAIKNKQIQIRDCRDTSLLFSLSCELIELVERKTRCIYNIMEITQKYYNHK